MVQQPPVQQRGGRKRKARGKLASRLLADPRHQSPNPLKHTALGAAENPHSNPQDVAQWQGGKLPKRGTQNLHN